MANRMLLLTGLIGLLAILISLRRSYAPAAPLPAPVQGKNNTVLFVVTGEHGLTNVHYAAASSLLEHHPHVSVHFSSFDKAAPKLSRISDFALRRSPAAKPIVFHGLPSPGYGDTLSSTGLTPDSIITPPGAAGVDKLVQHMQMFLSPFEVDHHLAIVDAIGDTIARIDPAVVVLDSLFGAGIDAARKYNRLTAVVSPNMVSDVFADKQPWGQMFWRYPAMGSGYAFPVPLTKIPSNIYLWIKFIFGVIRMAGLTAKNAVLKSHGIPEPVSVFTLHRPDMQWISASMPEASLPISVIPPNVTFAGPIVLSSTPLNMQDPELASWLASGPGTLLVNLGSSVHYTEDRVLAMAAAVRAVLDHTKYSVLWKFRPIGDYADPNNKLARGLGLQPYIDSGRLRMVDWIGADPPALLESGHIVASVHHGGANCYSEAVAAGVPHIVLPLWIDLYGYGALVEDLGIGVWAGRETAPVWKAEELSDAFLRVLDDSTASVAMREKASGIGKIARANPGREVAAKELARLAALGHA
jgi:hypothetical protein